MSGGLKQAEANRLLDSSVRGIAYTAPTTPMLLELTTTLPTATSNGTPVSGGSYAATAITTGTAASAGSVANTVATTYTNMPTATIVGADLKDSNGTPRYQGWGTLSKSTTAGDTLTIPIGSFTETLT